jgi:predicted lipoprotein with Yx(FWY)xxD motif
MRALFAAAAVLALASLPLSPAQAQAAAPATVSQAGVFTDGQGMTLYTYTRDMTGYSNCNDQCATVWPPLTATADAQGSGDWSIIVRDDGRRQWAFKGRALYHFAKDAQPGDATGDGAANGKWRVAKP